MNNHKIKGILFDLGNVLVSFDHRIAAARISEFCPKAPEDIYNIFFDSLVTREFEEGKVSPKEFFLKVKEILSLELDYDNFLPIWNEIFFINDDNNAVYDLAKKLKKRYKIAILSNVNVLHFEYLKKNFAVFDAFDHVIASYQEGCMKPDPLIYEKAMEALGVSSPDEVFYTDDRADLIEKAGALNIQSFVFQGAPKLKNDLISAGVVFNS